MSNRQSQSCAGLLLVKSNTDAKHRLSLFNRNARPVIFDCDLRGIPQI